MPRAQEARLRDALEDYVTAHRGDGRGRTGGLGVPDNIKTAQQLLESIGGSQSVREASPGERAARGAAAEPSQGAPNFNPPANLPGQ